MPSERLTRILLAKSHWSKEEIANLSDSEGWAWVYANASPKREKLPEICFTGFSATEKTELVTLATSAHLRVVQTVNQSLSYLCAGENAGPAKLAKATAQGVVVLTRQQFEALLETGETPA
jgi:NAD-dependent DNA ligase